MISHDHSTLDLSGTWTLRNENGTIAVPMVIPGDVHLALLDAGLIPDPYTGDNEDKVAWVAETPWILERRFELPAAGLPSGAWTLRLDAIDTIADIAVNGRPLARVDNQFLAYAFDVGAHLIPGLNTLTVTIHPAPAEAARRAKAHPFPVPYANMHGLGRVPHINFLRKTQCHAGWDWGLCLMPLGIYGSASLSRTTTAVLTHVQATQSHTRDTCVVTVVLHGQAWTAGRVPFSIALAGQSVSGEALVTAGAFRIERSISIANPKLWWPAGQGEPALYDLHVTLDGETAHRRLGLRVLELDTARDGDGNRMTFRVNGRDLFAKGANWIPADALPGRITPDVVRPQLEAAVAAHMNMIRVWGGGQYEPDWFYDLCDELGLLVWHDLMFSCMPYPSDPDFLQTVRKEVTHQVRRLSHHACLALWCGDNEVIGSLTWYPETKANRDRYLIGYDRLSRTLAEVVATEDPGRRFWASSPSLGDLDFADAWHVDDRGDMHYWSVWHEAKPFEAYRHVRPRFCSEFGFQSFPSPAVLRTFAEEEDLNVSSPVMEAHQRNDGGNTRIIETMTRYFRFPLGFTNLVYLSQVQQALAIKTAVEYWRSLKPRCMGTLYWQLNDCWPVASWASLEYGGGWKLLHHAATRFYAPVHVMANPDPASGEIVLTAVNDTAGPVDLSVTLTAVDMEGAGQPLATNRLMVPTDRTVEVARIAPTAIGAHRFLYWSWASADDRHAGENDYFPAPPKTFRLPDPAIEVMWSDQTLTLTASRPAFHVQVCLPDAGRFSENDFTLLAGQPKTIVWIGPVPHTSELDVRHLQSSYTRL